MYQKFVWNTLKAMKFFTFIYTYWAFGLKKFPTYMSPMCTHGWPMSDPCVPMCELKIN